MSLEWTDLFLTSLGGVIGYTLKPIIDRALNRDSKTFGVIYDKKFLIYNELYCDIIELKGILENNFHNGNDQTKAFIKKIEKFRYKILINRLLLDEKSIKLLNNYTSKCCEIHNSILHNFEKKLHSLDEIWSRNEVEKYLFGKELFKNDIFEIEKIMKNKLSIK